MAQEKLNATPGEVDAAMAKNLPPFEVWYTGVELAGKAELRGWLIVLAVGAALTLGLSLLAIQGYNELVDPAKYLTVTGIIIGISAILVGGIGSLAQWVANVNNLRRAKAIYCDWLDQLILARSTQVVSGKQDAQAT